MALKGQWMYCTHPLCTFSVQDSPFKDFFFGTYDFMYLRIDFKSGCNDGCAFINFADVTGMLSLIDRIERRLWPGFNSDKNGFVFFLCKIVRSRTYFFRTRSPSARTTSCTSALTSSLAAMSGPGLLPAVPSGTQHLRGS
jgi:hypothetical protein